MGRNLPPDPPNFQGILLLSLGPLCILILLNVSDGVSIGPDRDSLEKLMNLCINKSERSVSVIYMFCFALIHSTIISSQSFHPR